MGRRRQEEAPPEPPAPVEEPLQEKTPPAHTVRIQNLRGVIWENQGANGTWHSVVFHRTYRQGDDYRTAHTFSRQDLLTLAEIARQCWLWIARNTGAVGLEQGTYPEGGQTIADQDGPAF